MEEHSKKSLFKQIVGILFAIGITLTIVYLFLKNVGILSLIQILYELDWYVVLFPFLLYLCSHLLRSLRTYIILQKDISFNKIFDITCTHNLFNNVLPWRMGEFSHIFLLKKEGISGTKGVFTLSVLRIFDLISIFFFFVFALLLAPKSSPSFNYFAGFFLLILLLCVFSIIFLRQYLLRLLERIHERSLSFRLKTFFSKLIETIKHFETIQSKKMIVQMMAISLLIWFFLLFTDYLIVSHFFEISLGVFILGSCFAMLTYLLPIQGFMGFGTTEGAWAIVLIFFGFTNEQAIATGFAFHTLGLVYSIFLGVYGILRIKWR